MLPEVRESRLNKSWLVLILRLIGRRGSTSFLDQSQCRVKQNQTKMQFLSTLELNNLLYFHIHLLMLLAGCKCHRSACWRTWVWFKPTDATHLPALWKHYCSRWCPSYHSIWCVQHKVRHQASLFDNLSHGDQKKVCQWSFGKRGAL